MLEIYANITSKQKDFGYKQNSYDTRSLVLYTSISGFSYKCKNYNNEAELPGNSKKFSSSLIKTHITSWHQRCW